MRLRLLSKMSVVFAAIVVFAACSPVKIANIEKRRYRDGYYVDLKKQTKKAEDVALKNTDKQQELSYASSDDETTEKRQKKEVKKQIKALKSPRNKADTKLDAQKLIAVMENLSDKAVPIDLRRNQTSVPKRLEKRQVSGPSLLAIDGMERNAFILLVVVVVLLLILMKDITAILVAVLLVLLILFLLRQLAIINW